MFLKNTPSSGVMILINHSYSHRGRFYTLRELAEFDENGLWWIRSVGFSSRGTLVATAEGLVNASEAGYAVEELDAIVRVGTKDVLPKLAWEKRLRRNYCYISMPGNWIVRHGRSFSGMSTGSVSRRPRRKRDPMSGSFLLSLGVR